MQPFGNTDTFDMGLDCVEPSYSGRRGVLPGQAPQALRQSLKALRFGIPLLQ